MSYQSPDIWQRIETEEAIRPHVASRRPALERLLPAVAAAAILLGMYRHLFVEQDVPLWFDELFSAVIANQPDVGSFIDHCLRELSGPFYYAVLWSWVKVAGIGNAALRLPSVLCAIAAPLVILRWGHPDRNTRLIWAAIMALLLPLTYHANEAKPYSMLALLAVCQTIALTRLFRRPSASAAMAWSCLSSLMILTHYHALVITGLQALVILARGRQTIYWRAIWPFVATAAWMSFHFATILHFVNPKVSFYTTLGISDLWRIPNAIMGTAPLSILLIAMIGGTSLWAFLSPELRAVRAAAAKWDVAAALTSAGAVLAVTVLALLFPSYSDRYLLPYLPGLMFGIALWAVAWSRRIPALGTAIVLIFLLLAGRETANRLLSTDPNPYSAFNFARASRFIATAHPRRLIFLWDCTTATASGKPLFDEVAGFELARAGRPVKVDTMLLSAPGTDPNRALLAAASHPGDAILWTYDLAVHGTLGIHHPAVISRIDPRWTCQDFGNKQVKVVACVRRDDIRT